ncbi:MAG: TOBE domain-containing protein, partial [Nocardioides sp.]
MLHAPLDSQSAGGHRHCHHLGAAMAVVKVELAGGQSITSSITQEAVDDLGLA